MSTTLPPRWCTAVLRRVLPDERAADILGDLEESFRHKTVTAGERHARWWYRGEAARFGIWAIGERVRGNRRRLGDGPHRMPTRRNAMHQIAQDIRYAVRTLRKQPGFTFVVLSTLTLGIGANAAIFSAVNGILLRPLPFDAPDRLVQIWETRPMQEGRERNVASFPDFVDWRRDAETIRDMAAYAFRTSNLIGDDAPIQTSLIEVTEDFFALLRVEAAIGRTFTPDEFIEGNDAVIVLHHGFWQRRYGGDSSVVGTTMSLDGNPYVIVGVLPSEFRFIDTPDAWIPLPPRSHFGRGGHFIRVLGRLAGDATLDQARTELDGIARRLEAEHPEVNTGHYAVVYPLQDEVVRGLRPALMVLSAAVGVVLLLVCVNVANMQVARSLAREPEIAVRTTLGATRGRILTQLFWENALLAGGAAVLGTGLAAVTLGTIEATLARAEPVLGSVVVDGRVLAFVALVSVGALIVFGFAPAMTLARPDLARAINEGSRRSVGSPARRRVRGALVVAEFAMAVVLVIGAGLMTRSFARLTAVDPGFEPAGLLTAQVVLPLTRYGEPQTRIDFVDELLTRFQALPEVSDASLNWLLPFTDREAGRNFTIEGRPEPDRGDVWNAAPRIVTADYFDTMRIPLLQGRTFDVRDARDAPGAVLVNRTMAERFWPHESPIGARIRLGDDEAPWLEVVGIVGDVRQLSLRSALKPELYLPYAQAQANSITVVLRTTGRPMDLAEPVRRQVWAIDPELPVSEIASMDGLIRSSVGQSRTNTAVMGAFAAVSMLMAAIGIYGVMSFTVHQRAHEIGVRMALGAQRRDVMAMVVVRGMELALSGIGIGLVVAVAASRGMQAMLFQIPPTDAATYVGGSLVLASVGLAANYLPARRATRLNPMTTLRQS